MTIETKELYFSNVLIYKNIMLKEDWQDGVVVMENFTLSEDIYRNGPVFFSVKSVDNEPKFGQFEYFLPINERVELEKHPNFRFEPEYEVGEALVLRQASEEIDFQTAYSKVKDYADSEGIELEDTYYCFLLEVYEDIIIDVYVPIKRGDSN
ncbi:protein of unknown function [Terribacillus halophilus]|uniref:DUF5085 domain-containing protein n=1 Tax=Terribacillus halophilus TaxID=361279 RepID=A0A1G6PY96_9BACI|nr:DUF5085 family protein [Terribacillus halophilus]SDC84634.1 protein of unknown function [Terribacillus halophilus]